MIGYWNYTVYATYASAASAVLGMGLCVLGRPVAAVFCLLFSAFMDMIDGRIARTKRDRSREEKRYGVQLDSLADVLAFGALPAVIAVSEGLTSVLGLAVALCFTLCCLIRLAFFNVRAAADEDSSDGGCLAFKGLPAPSIALPMALLYCFRPLLSQSHFTLALTLLLAAVALAFITPFTLKKPGLKVLLPLAGLGIITLIALIVIYV